MRTALRIGVIGALVFAIALGFLYVTQRERLLHRLATSIEAELSERAGGPVEIERLSLEFAPLALVAEGVTVHAPLPALPAPLTVGRIILKPSLISLLTETLVIRAMIVERPRIEVVTDEAGRSNLPTLGVRQPTPGSAPAMLVRRITLNDTELIYRTPEYTVTISPAHITVLPDLVTDHVVLDVTAPTGTVARGDRRVTLGASTLRAVADGGNVAIQQLSIEGPGLSVAVDGGLQLGPPSTVDLRATISMNLEHVALLAPHAAPLGGHLAVSGRLRGTATDPDGDGTIAVHGLVYDGITIGNFSSPMTVSRREIIATDLTGDILDGSIRGSARVGVDTDPPAWAVSLTAERVRPVALMRRLAAPVAVRPVQISGPIALRGRGWSLSTASGEGRLAVTTHEPPPAPADGPPGSRVASVLALIRSADLPWTLRDGSLALADADVSTETGRLAVAGTIGSRGDLDLAVALREQPVTPIATALRTPFPISGQAAFDGRLLGTLKAPQILGRAAIRNLIIRDHTAGTLETTLDYQDRRLTFRDTAWRKGASRYEPVGTVDWNSAPAPSFDISARLHNARVGDVLPLVFKPLPIEADADGTFTFRGSTAEFRIAGELTLADGSLYGQSFDRGSVGLEFDRTRVVFRHADLHRGESHVRGRGTIIYRAGHEATFEAVRVNLQTLDLFALNTLPLSGTVSGTLTTAGSFARPEMHATATIRHVEGAGQSLGGGSAVLDVKDHRLQLTARLDEQRARLEASLAWQPGFPVSAALTVDQSSLVPLIQPWLPSAFAGMSAAVSGRITLDGPLGDPLRWRVETRLTALSADVGEFLVENNGDVVVSLDSGRVTIGAVSLRGTDTTLNVTGGVDLFREYRLFIAGEADLHLARLLVPDVSSGRGKTYLVLKISDRWDNPKIQGGVTVQNASFKSRTLPKSLAIDSMGLFFNERQVLLESFEGSFGKGRVSATGQIQLKGFRPERFGYLIDLREIDFPLAEHLTPTMSGQLVFQGTPEAQSLRGELTIDRSMYEARIDLQERLLELRRRAALPQTSGAPAAIAQGIALNVHFTGKDRIGIQNNLARVPLEVDLFLRGTVDRPYLIGRVEAREGQFNFLGNEFAVQSATVDFIDPTRIRPVIDLRATTTVRPQAQSYRITLQLTGTIERFDLDLTSDPSLSETDILALLTVGRTTEEVAQSQNGFGRQEAAALALQALLEEGVQRVPSVGRLVDCLQVDPSYDPTANTSAPELSVCKQLLDDRLTFNYATTLDGSGRQTVRVEYQLSRSLYLIGEQTDRGFGGDVRYRFEFR